MQMKAPRSQTSVGAVCVLALFVCRRCLCVRAVLSASAADVFLFVVDPGRVVFGFLGLIHFTTETGI